MKATLTNDDGFTLAEAMMSLLVIGLAFGGLIQVAAQGAKTQARSIALQKDMKLADEQTRLLSGALAKVELVGSEPLTGRIDYLSAKGRDGQDRLYRAPHGWRLSYFSEGARSDQWPRQVDENRLPGVERPRLEAVAFSNSKGHPIALIKTPIEQGVDCQFDMISRHCREAGR